MGLRRKIGTVIYWLSFIFFIVMLSFAMDYIKTTLGEKVFYFILVWLFSVCGIIIGAALIKTGE